ISALMSSAALTDILCARSATEMVSGTAISRTIGPAAAAGAPSSPPSSSWRRGPPTFGWRQPVVAVPPVTSPRSFSARRRAASSWNAVPLFLIVRAFSPGFVAGRCNVPSPADLGFAAGAVAGAFAAASAAFAASAAAASAANLAAASSASFSFLVLRFAACACFCWTSSCWRAMSSWPFFSSAARAASSSGVINGGGAAGAGASSTTGAGSSSRFTKTRFLRTSTWIVRALPIDPAALISVVCLRVSVIFFFGSPAAPCCFCRNSSNLVLSISESLSPSFLPATPALPSCSSSAIAGILSSVANCSIVVCAMRFSGLASALVVRPQRGGSRIRRGFRRCVFEPMRAGLHDEILRALRRDSGQLHELVAGEIGQRVARRDAMRGERTRNFGVHTLEVEQRLLDVLDRLLAHDRLREKRVAGAAPKLVDRLFVEALDLEHFGDRDVRDFLERGEAFGDQDVGNFLVDVELLHEQAAQTLALLFMLLRRILDAHQVQLPSGKLGGKPHVLPETADRDGEVLLVDDDVHAVLLLVDHDRRDLRRRQRVDHELRGIVRVKDDVDPLAGQLVGHRGDARAAHAEARALPIEPRVVRLDGDLGANARVAGGRLDFDQAFLDFRHFELEETHQEFGRDPRQDQLRALRRAVHFRHKGANPVADAQHFLCDQLVARNHALDAPGFDDRAAALYPFHGAGEQVVFALEEVVQDLLALGVADFLQADLLRCLRADATELDRLERFLDDIAELQVRVALGGIGDRKLIGGFLVIFIRHDRPAPERLVVAGFAVDRHARVDLVRKTLFRGRRERRLERREHDALRNVLFARKRIDKQQQFAVHLAFLHSIFGTSRARSMSASGIVTAPFAVSTTTAPASQPRSTPFSFFVVAIGLASFNSASSPAKRTKSAAFLSGRSSPGDETSSLSNSMFSTANSRVR